MLNILIVGCGGFLGTVMRYLLNLFIYKILDAPLYPFGTMTINILGCFFIGFITSLAESRAALTLEWRLFLLIGVLGGFTTFSTFGYETFALIRDGQFTLGLANIFIQVLLGLMAVWMGYYLVEWM